MTLAPARSGPASTNSPRTPDVIAESADGEIDKAPDGDQDWEAWRLHSDDIDVPILVLGPGAARDVGPATVHTMLVVRTSLRALGPNPTSLLSVLPEGTQPVPLEGRGEPNDRRAVRTGTGCRSPECTAFRDAPQVRATSAATGSGRFAAALGAHERRRFGVCWGMITNLLSHSPPKP